jgi:hypothetical protein
LKFVHCLFSHRKGATPCIHFKIKVAPLYTTSLAAY